MKKIIAFLCVLFPLAAAELTPQVEEDLTVIVKCRMIDPSFESQAAKEIFAPLIKAIRGENADVDAVMKDVLDYVYSPEAIASCFPPFLKEFTAEEISLLRRIYEDPTMIRLENNHEIRLFGVQLLNTLMTKVIPEKMDSDLPELTAATFNNFVAHGKVIVDVYAVWCGPCRTMAPYFKELSQEMPEIAFVKVNATDEMELVKSLKVTGLPTFILYDEGKEVARVIGACTKEELKHKIEEAFSLLNDKE